MSLIRMPTSAFALVYSLLAHNLRVGAPNWISVSYIMSMIQWPQHRACKMLYKLSEATNLMRIIVEWVHGANALVIIECGRMGIFFSEKI